MRPVYLDANATTPVDPDVLATMLPFFTEHFGNPSSPHGFGAVVAAAVKRARGQLQSLLGAESDQEIIFTSGGTESDTTAILSALATQEGRNELIVSAVEHPAVLALAQDLAKRAGVVVHVIPVDGRGRLDIDAYEKVLGRQTALVSIMWANNETGTIFPVERLAAMAHEAGALFHTDAVQAVGKIAMDLQSGAIDMLSLSGHKLHGPKGIGALYVRRGVPFQPLIRGGRQERGRRSGTENVPAIVGLGKAAELAAFHLYDEQTRVRELRDHLEAGVLAAIDKCIVTGDVDNRLPNTSNIAFDGVEGEAIVHLLSRDGVAVSSGSACSSGGMDASHVIRAMRLPFTAAHGAVRFSLSRDNEKADVDRLIEIFPDIIEELRAVSPFWRKARQPAKPQERLYA
ncbi:cysteine desulfurase NifS [Afifella marina]|uniref:Cysteine desulfurase n=1 Tax=Afifella marina DSM 2698 TaxID=1120955 RepID=A0A1G5N538_AFIMA|nr:cysteine desulfurase NifS [Afifella marina]MBK1622489.1 cysteine desulfurase NifS [Afifella marina DSM 2698]MBK1626796.1 cysteine desulfurase NifS [Afifella marina]MBK5919274.1 cysteine desulfurase NifS [Afifella marina]RAI21312.1 cysteine desulfurase NifS [Afifella marina DSM 2698]SCZ32452.1 cysteine desulfurase [Afifella marina DSM 2698]